MQPNRGALTALLIAGLASVGPVNADVEGSADYPEIGRFEGSEILDYKDTNFDETFVATGPVKSKSDASNARRLEGRIVRILYRVPPGSSDLEVFRNFEQKISQAGYETEFSGRPEDFNYRTFLYDHPVEKLNSISLTDKIWYLLARKTDEEAERWLSLIVSPHSGGDGQRVRLIVAETKQMENRMVDAEQMQASILETGRVALYGIYFDTDSAELKPESEPTMQEIAALLGSDPSMKIIVVGHTDNQGGYDYNMRLSERRAAAVAAGLTADYGIDGSRLKSAGVGYLAPAASNADEAGRALNRRVELVKDAP